MADWIEVRTEEVDEAGTVTAGIFEDALRVGELVYAAWGPSLVVQSLAVDPAHRERVEPQVVGLLCRRVVEEGMTSFHHHGVQDAALLRAYAAQPLGASMVAIGVCGGDVVYFDPVRGLHPPEGGHVHVALYHTPELGPLGEVTATADPYALLQCTPSLARVARLRALWTAGHLDDDALDEVFLYALLDTGWDVRQFAAVTLNGALGDREQAADLPRLLAHLAEPLCSLRPGLPLPVAPEGVVFDPVRARRNKRQALLFVLGTRLAWTFRSDAQRDALRAALAEVLQEQLDALTPAREALLGEAAVEDARPGGPGGTALGRIDDLGLLELLRYAVLRHRAWVADQGDAPDPFAWLTDQVACLVPSPRSPAGDAEEPLPDVADRLYGPSPAVSPQRASA
ncbi:MAG: hypothetical protein H6732_00600 [Alphaproteobacteria bacterium]|nr:hypothetical protein [Alphaproteobacteria bacterium]